MSVLCVCAPLLRLLPTEVKKGGQVSWDLVHVCAPLLSLLSTEVKTGGQVSWDLLNVCAHLCLLPMEVKIVLLIF